MTTPDPHPTPDERFPGTGGCVVAGAAAIALRGEEVLLVRRARPPSAGRWSFPGGVIEPGETAREAAAREAREETGLELRVLEVVEVFDAILPAGGGEGFHYCVADFLAEPLDPAAEPVPGDDVDAARWVPLAEVESYPVTPSVPRVLARALQVAQASEVAQAFQPASGEVAQAFQPAVGQPGKAAPLVAGLHVLTAAGLRPGRTHLDVARAALAGGARVVQLRDKQAEAGELVALAREIGALARAAGALFIVNDRVDVALAAEADGVHLGVDDLPVRDARRLLGAGRIVGYSPATLEQAQAAAEAGADYLGVGDVFGTPSKGDAGEPIGSEGLRRVIAATPLPVIAIGGITRERLAEVLAAGARGAAVMSAVAAAEDMEAAARELVGALGEEGETERERDGESG